VNLKSDELDTPPRPDGARPVPAGTILKPVQSELREVEARLGSVADEVDVPLLGDLLRHVLRGKGKLLRPALAFLSARFYEYPVERLVRLAAAVELLHTASLIHDDLVDGSTTRRGLPTLHMMASPKVTVLVGDYLFARSAALATSTESLDVMALFARTLTSICNGELREIGDSPDSSRNIDRYYQRIQGKTASLFVAATEGGGILSKAPALAIQGLSDYGLNLGMAFQIADDVLDFVGTEDELGKPVGSDLRQGTLTLPAIWLLDHRPAESVLTRVIASENPDDDMVREAVALVVESPAVKFAQDQAEAFADMAKQSLQILPDGPSKQSLVDLADYAVRRRM
jgi:geranylgeranyl pyrophosphate synthase